MCPCIDPCHAAAMFGKLILYPVLRIVVNGNEFWGQKNSSSSAGTQYGLHVIKAYDAELIPILFENYTVAMPTSLFLHKNTVN